MFLCVCACEPFIPRTAPILYLNFLLTISCYHFYIPLKQWEGTMYQSDIELGKWQRNNLVYTLVFMRPFKHHHNSSDMRILQLHAEGYFTCRGGCAASLLPRVFQLGIIPVHGSNPVPFTPTSALALRIMIRIQRIQHLSFGSFTLLIHEIKLSSSRCLVAAKEERG